MLSTANLHEKVAEILSAGYTHPTVRVHDNYCPSCFHSPTYTHVHVKKNRNATSAWLALMQDGIVCPIQILNVISPADTLKSKLVFNRNILGINTTQTPCSNQRLCESKCICLVCGQAKEPNESVVTDTWPGISIHKSCCAQCAVPGCTDPVPTIPQYFKDKLGATSFNCRKHSTPTAVPVHPLFNGGQMAALHLNRVGPTPTRAEAELAVVKRQMDEIVNPSLNRGELNTIMKELFPVKRLKFTPPTRERIRMHPNFNRFDDPIDTDTDPRLKRFQPFQPITGCVDLVLPPLETEPKV
jgi:hypothetical protein